MDAVVENLTKQWSAADEARQLAAWKAYHGILSQLAKDEAPKDAEAARGTLETLGKSSDDLAADVQVFRDRLKWNRDAKGDRAAAERDLANAQADLDKARREFEQAQDKFAAASADAQAKEADAQERIGVVKFARERLAATVIDPGLRRRVVDFEAKRQSLLGEHRDLRNKVHQAKLRADEAAKNAAPLPKPAKGEQPAGAWSKLDQERSEARAAEAAQNLEDLQSQLVAVEQSLADLEGEQAELDAQKLTP